jgi:hypothetical protein
MHAPLIRRVTVIAAFAGAAAALGSGAAMADTPGGLPVGIGAGLSSPVTDSGPTGHLSAAGQEEGAALSGDRLGGQGEVELAPLLAPQELDEVFDAGVAQHAVRGAGAHGRVGVEYRDAPFGRWSRLGRAAEAGPETSARPVRVKACAQRGRKPSGP